MVKMMVFCNFLENGSNDFDKTLQNDRGDHYGAFASFSAGEYGSSYHGYFLSLKREKYASNGYPVVNGHRVC